ncbi:hypothetical protein [Beijerinckia mobilis]|uniref:hypothetical protein n=1 Tax=Beijerinckia mobilis TaxID=231434 RepID=UPI00054E916B|nr:hypothetical protein [Beijerinckia mobilis]
MREEQDKVLVFDKARYKRAKQEPLQIRQDDKELIKMCELICEFGEHFDYILKTDNLNVDDQSEIIDLINNRLFQPLLKIVGLRSFSELGVAAKEQALAAYKTFMPCGVIDNYTESLINSINNDIRTISSK